MTERVVVVGAGQAGARVALELRSAGFSGSVVLVGAEPHLPYERPQLSKEMLTDPAWSTRFMKAQSDWSAAEIDLRLGSPVVDADPNARVVALAGGEELSYDHLVLATGTSARQCDQLAGLTVPIHVLRTIEDAAAIRERMAMGGKILIVGGGIIGLEVAAAAAGTCDVTVVEAGSRLFERGLPAEASEHLERLHAGNGVRFRYDVRPVSASGCDTTLSDGSVESADLVVVGIGVEPPRGIAAMIGLPEGAQGLRVDDRAVTERSGVLAVGDATEQFSRCHNRWMRIETWANANQQAAIAAASITGTAQPAKAAPWFWSDQYSMNIQVAGDSIGEETVLRGDPASGRFAVIALRGGEIVGGTTINVPKDMAAIRKLVGNGIRLERAAIEDPAYKLRQAIPA
ncbi:FAD-dependent oxidoreductase [Maritimibacter alexandrii]|jgi:NADPH-dependent 2,4-dienoyl-CoA reductase/sulfur reductase-like enzyme|uniref:NAD(P)/FAD-dependent oxidoreductase n=1 Tax=Maritimibacter alexandrii TaxID=2570355 RepID=UPI00110831B4|nr:FAD-dependent oxidoreductase [Maritimibacter alexandrii]